MANRQPDHLRPQQPHQAALWPAATGRFALAAAANDAPDRALAGPAPRRVAFWGPPAAAAAVPCDLPWPHGGADPSVDRPARDDEQHDNDADPWVPPGWRRPLPQPDPRPGFYYVAAADDLRHPRRYALLAGPFGTHPPALEMVDVARRAALEVDPWAGFAAFGTCRTPDNRGPGRLNTQLGLSVDPDGLVSWPPPAAVGEEGQP